MAATVTIKTINDGPKNLTVHTTVVGDAGGDITDYNFLSAATTGGPGACIAKLQYQASGCTGLLKWTASTPRVALVMAPDNSGTFDFAPSGFIQNSASSGTGAISLTTVGLAAGDSLSFTLTVKKS